MWSCPGESQTECIGWILNLWFLFYFKNTNQLHCKKHIVASNISISNTVFVALTGHIYPQSCSAFSHLPAIWGLNNILHRQLYLKSYKILGIMWKMRKYSLKPKLIAYERSFLLNYWIKYTLLSTANPQCTCVFNATHYFKPLLLAVHSRRDQLRPGECILCAWQVSALLILCLKPVYWHESKGLSGPKSSLWCDPCSLSSALGLVFSRQCLCLLQSV